MKVFIIALLTLPVFAKVELCFNQNLVFTSYENKEVTELGTASCEIEIIQSTFSFTKTKWNCFFNEDYWGMIEFLPTFRTVTFDDMREGIKTKLRFLLDPIARADKGPKSTILDIFGKGHSYASRQWHQLGKFLFSKMGTDIVKSDEFRYLVYENGDIVMVNNFREMKEVDSIWLQGENGAIQIEVSNLSSCN